MKGEVLHFGHEWTVGDGIGDGGFGQVYSVTGADGVEAAAKFVPKRPGAERELLFVTLDGVPNVVPVIDSGEHNDYWVLVMTRAEKSLRDLLDAHPVPTLETTLAVLIDVAQALAGLDGKVVHRDLKPENVLLVEGKWCVADFGISRYADASTATNTSKFALSMPYAGPERWRLEHAEPSTDIYSLGVIAFEMLVGSWPFPGPSESDFRDQHLHKPSPAVANGPVPLQSLVTECLYKAASARPPAANVVARLEALEASPAVGALAALQAANQKQVIAQADEALRESAARTEQEQTAALFGDGASALILICNELKQLIADNAPKASIASRSSALTVTLGPAKLQISVPQEVSPGAMPGGKFKVVGSATISISQPGDHLGYRGRSHSLWFCDAVTAGEFAWYETAFMDMFFGGRRTVADESTVPYALPPGDKAAAGLMGGIDVVQVAWPFTILRPGDTADFQERWLGWFAAAASGTLHRPSQLPERSPRGSWRH